MQVRARRGRLAAAVAGVVLGAALTACGVPHDGHVHRVGPRHVPNRLVAPATPTADGGAR